MSHKEGVSMRENIEPIHVAYIPDQFRFEYLPEKTITLDIIDSELMVESFLGDEVKTITVLSSIQSWIKETQEVELSTSAAWSLWQSIRTAYEAHKKKLLHSLSSAIATASTPSNSIPEMPSLSSGKSHDFGQSKKSDEEIQKQPSVPKQSTI